ncbi:MAG: hypothetical protein ABR592_12500 [Nitriliruptorales bacterium]
MTDVTRYSASPIAAADLQAGDVVEFENLPVAVVRDVAVDDAFVTLELTVTRRADDVLATVRGPRAEDQAL